MMTAEPAFRVAKRRVRRARQRLSDHALTFVGGCMVLLLSGGREAGAEPTPSRAEPEKRSFALIVGVNQSVDANHPPLVYADDDAVRYHELFRALGMHTYLLTRLDANTHQVFPDAVAEAPPRAQELWRTASTLAGEIAQARRAGASTVLYVVYAGHGGADDEGHAFITLEDARITGEELGRRLVDELGAEQTHVVVDACYSYYLAYERGAGGKRRDVRGFSEFRGLGARSHVGLLLSTSSARESHEWEGFHAGVFSHEIRSGLYGAADVDGDGRVSYREIAAFIARANQAIPNDRFRPDVYARPPSGGSDFVDLRPGLGRSLTVDREARAGRHYIEDQRGNRLADFHNGAGQTLRLMRPQGSGSLYLHRLGDHQEYELRPAPAHLVLSQLATTRPRSRSRGAVEHAYNLLFSLPFDQRVVRAYAFTTPAAPAAAAGPHLGAEDGPAQPGGDQVPDSRGSHRDGHHLHDEFYVRLYAGPAQFSVKEIREAGHPPETWTFSGLGTSYGGALGYALVPNFIFYWEVVGARVSGLEESGRMTIDRLNQLGFGPGVAYYYARFNLHASGTLTFPMIWMGKSDVTNLGYGFNMMMGKEWWISGDWAIGVAGQAHFATMSFGSDDAYVHDFARFQTRTFSLLLSATYN